MTVFGAFYECFCEKPVYKSVQAMDWQKMAALGVRWCNEGIYGSRDIIISSSVIRDGGNCWLFHMEVDRALLEPPIGLLASWRYTFLFSMKVFFIWPATCRFCFAATSGRRHVCPSTCLQAREWAAEEDGSGPSVAPTPYIMIQWGATPQHKFCARNASDSEQNG